MHHTLLPHSPLAHRFCCLNRNRLFFDAPPKRVRGVCASEAAWARAPPQQLFKTAAFHRLQWLQCLKQRRDYAKILMRFSRCEVEKLLRQIPRA